MPKNDDGYKDDEIEGVESEDEDLYEEEEREEEEENDQITPTEEAFMEGYEEEDKVAECANCKKSLLNMKGTVEREFKGSHFRFCSEKCAKSYKFK